MPKLVVRMLPLAILLIFSTATVALWREQVEHQRLLLTRHTRDVTVQASRRLEIFVDSRLTVADLFARRWIAEGEGDFSHERFDGLASLLIEEIPGYHAMGLVRVGDGTVWATPPGNRSLGSYLATHPPLLDEALGAAGGAVSAPIEIEGDDVGFFAALALQRGERLLGWVAVEFRAKPLIDDCLHERIRGEFGFAVSDGDATLFRYPPERSDESLTGLAVYATQAFPVRNRTWRLTVAPRAEQVARAGWTANLPMPVFGFSLSIGVSLLVYLLLRRMRAYRQARDDARRAMRQQDRLARKVLLAQEEERARLSRDLHDVLGQSLSAIRLELDWLQRQRRDGQPAVEPRHDQVDALLEDAAEQLRSICQGLKPPWLDEIGLDSSLAQLVQEFRQRTSLPVRLDVDLPDGGGVSPEAALVTYRVLQEALTNVQRHAGARSVTVSLARRRDELVLSVGDDGRGFDPSDLTELPGLGLAGMQERAKLVNGQLEIASGVETGTTIVLRVPIARDAGREAP